MSRLSVVILNWNGADMLERYLPSVISCSPEADIVVADNGSTDCSIQMLKKRFPEVVILPLGENYGFAEGYNRALSAVDSEYFLLLNSDVRVTEGWLTPLLDYMDAHPEVAACQPKIRCEWQQDDFEYAGACGGFIDWLGYPFCRGRLMATVERDVRQYEEVIPVFWATGAAMLIRSQDYRQVGGLDGRFFAHQEEIDLCWRLRSRGRGIVCIPQSVVFHQGGGTLPKGSPRKTFLNFRNNLLLLYKNLPEERLQDVLRIRFWLDYLAALQMLLTGQWRSVLAVWQARREFYRLLPEFQLSRQENLRQTVVHDIPEQVPYSLLWKYYVCGKRRFSQL